MVFENGNEGFGFRNEQLRSEDFLPGFLPLCQSLRMQKFRVVSIRVEDLGQRCPKTRNTELFGIDVIGWAYNRSRFRLPLYDYKEPVTRTEGHEIDDKDWGNGEDFFINK
jgi:hypothetical protein